MTKRNSRDGRFVGDRGTYVSRSGTRTLVLAPHERDEYGITVTATDGVNTISLARKNAPETALREICAALDALEGDWRIVTISTPTTIYRDLQGSRFNQHNKSRDTPEANLLSRIGRLDLLAPPPPFRMAPR